MKTNAHYAQQCLGKNGLRTPGRQPRDIEENHNAETGNVDGPKTMAGHQATKRMAICCVPNEVGEVRCLIKSMNVLNDARIRMKKKTL